MEELTHRALSGFAKFQLILAALLFVPARTVFFWEAWGYWLVIFISFTFITVYFIYRDPRILQARVGRGARVEQDRSQKIIHAAATALTFITFATAGLDHFYDWSSLPFWIVVFADAVVMLSLAIAFFVFRSNPFAFAVIKVEPGQKAISSGPYRFVRHPLYSAGMLMFLATPFALGSVWAIVPVILLCLSMVIRLLREETFLLPRLEGYRTYCEQVSYRLIPGIW